MDPEEQEAIRELLAMSRAELDRVPYTAVKWLCECRHCTNGTTARDYGVPGLIYVPRTGWGWIAIRDNYLLCAKHHKFFKRLARRFEKWHIERRLLEPKHKLIHKATGTPWPY